MDEVLKKQCVEQQYAASTQGMAGQQIGYAVDECNKRELLIHRLQRQERNVGHESQKLSRASDILTRHPEFEELLELLRSGLI